MVQSACKQNGLSFAIMDGKLSREVGGKHNVIFKIIPEKVKVQ